MKKEKGFTLIELLAVVIILGVLMIIAIPSVSKYINDSKKNGYVSTAKGITNGVRNLINGGELDLNDLDTTYYVSGECVKTENSYRSPYGEFDKAYIVVTATYDTHEYYWISVDKTGVGVKNLVNVEDLDKDKIEIGIDSSEIVTNKGIDRRSKVVVIDGNCQKSSSTEATSRVDGNNGHDISLTCKKATVQHTAICERNDGIGCNGMYEANSTITYGTIPSGALKPGDAFDCDINGDGIYDSSTERFYFVKTEGINSVLIYYTNINNQTMYAYDSAKKNIYGPRTGYQYLPSTSDWNIPGAILPGTRSIVNEIGTKTTAGGTIESFTYTDRIARFLTVQEVNYVCGIDVGTSTVGELNSCPWLMENIGYFERTSGSRSYGYWLENARSSTNYEVWCLDGRSRFVYKGATNSTSYCGVRPVITIPTSHIE